MAGEREEVDAEIDRLYALPLDEFTAARNGLARRLRREVAPAAGDEVKQLRKPSVAAWALNQVRRHDPERSDHLLEAGQLLLEDHERLLAGGVASARAGHQLRAARREAERVARAVERATAIEAETRRRAEEAVKAAGELEHELHRLAPTRTR